MIGISSSYAGDGNDVDAVSARFSVRRTFRHMVKADAIMFWFPCETLCPITLFELGKWVATDKKLFIGHHPEYQRKNDIRIQVGLVRGKRQKIHDSLEGVAGEIKRWEMNVDGARH